MTDPVVTSPARRPKWALAGEVAVRMVLNTAMWLALWVVVPTVALGWQPVVVAGNSMQTGLRPGDALLVDTVASGDPLDVGTIITYRRGIDDKVVTHRIIEVGDDGHYVTKGDANSTADSDPVAPDQVLGTARLVVPMVAMVAVGGSVAAPAMGLVLLLALTLVVPRLHHKQRPEPPARRARPEKPERPAPTPIPARPAPAEPVVVLADLSDIWTAHGGGARRVQPRLAAVVLLLTSVQLVAVPAPLAQAAFRESTSSAASQWQAGVIENPTGLTLTFTNVLCTLRSMGLSWTVSTDPDVTSQQIYKTAGAGARTLLATKTAGASTHTDLAVNCGVTYVYEVVSVAAYGGTTWTSAVVNGQNRKSITT